MVRIVNHISADGITTEIKAYAADYHDYGGLFQCVECQTQLELVSGHFRGETWISAYFKHHSSSERECSLKAKPGVRVSSDFFDIVTKGQSKAKLQNAFLKCFMFYMCGCCHHSSWHGYKHTGLIPFWSWNPCFSSPAKHLNQTIKRQSSPGRIHADPELLLDAFSRLFTSRHADNFIQQLLSKFKVRLLKDKDSLRYFCCKSEIKKRPKQELTEIHVRQVDTVLKFIRGTCNENTRKEFVRGAICALNVDCGFSYHQDISVFTEKASALSLDVLNEILSSPLYIKELFTNFYYRYRTVREQYHPHCYRENGMRRNVV